MNTTYYIVPAGSDQAGQCRIVARPTAEFSGSARDSYRQSPKSWREAGLMNSRGELVCVDTKAAWQEFKDCEPLMAGLEVRVESKQSELMPQ